MAIDLTREVVCETFEDENEFFAVLSKLQEIDKMEEASISEMKLTTETEGEACSTGLYLSHGEETLRVPEAALFSIKRRFKNTAEILGRMTPDDQAKMLNMSIPYVADTEVQLYKRGDLLIGMHSNHYAAIGQNDLYKAFRNNLMLSYDEFVFLGATYKHDVTEALYKVVDIETAQRYVKALIDAGKSASLKDIDFNIALRTSDAATCSVSVQPYVIMNGKESTPLSQAMHLDHRDGIDMQDVRDMFLKIYSYNADAVDNLANMLSIELSYPSSVIKRLANKYKLPLKPLKAIAERFAVEMLGETMSAHDLYVNACLSMRTEKFTNMSEARQLEAQDAFSKILKTTEDEWKKMDRPAPTLLD